MRIVFMGTPQFAVPSLKALVEAGHEVCGVFSQPDKPVGRHQNKLKPTPVKECALSYQAAGRDIPVYQPEKLRDGTALAILKELAPELIVVAAYGRILPDDILALPPKGCINVHSSLLPKYRGAAPFSWRRWPGSRPGPPAGRPRIPMGCPLPPCCPRSCLRWTGAGAPRRSTTRSGA